jgi:hypothetical protein
MSTVDDILKGKYPAKDHARRVTEWIVKNGGKKEGMIYLEGQKFKLNEVCNHQQHQEIELSSDRIMIRRHTSGILRLACFSRQ